MSSKLFMYRFPFHNDMYYMKKRKIQRMNKQPNNGINVCLGNMLSVLNM
jgi:hypothetical protein